MSTAAPSPTPADPARPVRCAVLGSPISHSLSPVLHRAAYAELGLDWEYAAHEVGEHELAAFLDGLDETWRGLSLTMPLKRAVLPLLDDIDERASLVGAANTVVLGSGRRRVGHNTDVPGAVAAIRERSSESFGSAVVLGGGATAASLMHALADLGCTEIMVVVREESRAASTVAAARRHPQRPKVDVRRFGSSLPAADMLVSTIPASAQSPEVVALAGSARLVFDVVYDPWPTPLAEEALRREATFVSGLDLLVHQAALQVALMTGASPPPLAVMRAASEQFR